MNKGFTLIEAVASLTILSVVLLGGYSMIQTSVMHSNVTDTRLTSNSIARGVSNYFSSFNYDKLDSLITSDYLHIDSSNCSQLFTSSNDINVCTKVLNPIINNYQFQNNQVFVIFFKPNNNPKINMRNIDNSRDINLYSNQIYDEIDKFSFDDKIGQLIYYLVVTKGENNIIFTVRGVIYDD